MSIEIESRLKLNLAVLGPRLNSDVQKVITAAKFNDWKYHYSEVYGDTIIVGGVLLFPKEYIIEDIKQTIDNSNFVSAPLAGGGMVILDINITPELEAEGIANDVIREIQQARRELGLQVSDRITLTLNIQDSLVRSSVETWMERVMSKTLATSIVLNDLSSLNQAMTIAITVAERS